MQPNPVPPAPHVTGAHYDEWVRRTFPVGTPVMFTDEFSYGPNYAPDVVPSGTKGEIVEVWDDSDMESVAVTVELYPSYQIPKGTRIDLRRETLHAGSKYPVDYHGVGSIKPLVDTWETPAGPTGRHHLPRSQRSWMRPNGPTLLQAADVAQLPIGSIVFQWNNGPSGSALVVLPGGDLTQIALLPEHDDGEEPGGDPASAWGASFALVKEGHGRLPTHGTAQRAAVDWMKQRSWMQPNADQQPLHAFRNEEDGVEARVWDLGPRGYSVTLFDLDAEETVQASRVFRRAAEAEAIAFAKSLVGKSVEPNPKARSLGRRPAMDTKFGQTVEDPDALSGAPGRHLDKAMSRYETFHAKSPIRVAELEHDLPKDWVEIGDALAVMYRTDKWKRDGNDEDYKHLHDRGDDKPYDLGRGVRLFEPAAEAKRSKVGTQRANTGALKRCRLPVSAPKAITLLGYCLGFFVRRDEDGEIYECNPRGCYLFCSPSGDMLLVYSPDKQPDGSSGVLAIMAGGNLRVLKDGIDG